MYKLIYMDRVSQYKTVHTEALSLFTKKNQDYGDAFANYGPVGVIVRMGDKINRLASVTGSSVTLVKNETIRDTLIDLHNYAAMAIMLMDEKEKPKEKIKKYDDTFIDKNMPRVESVGHELSEMDTIVWDALNDLSGNN
tara:strand:+ start:270 stop:686 length:417 start_codon:yes stop_codon:yes gene_type:complete